MSKKHKYKNDYEVEEVKRNGIFRSGYRKELIYKGRYYTIKSENNSITHLKWSFFFLICLIAAVFLGAGLLNNEGSRKVYIVIPYAFMFLPVFYGAMGTVKLLMVQEKMTLAEYEHSVERIKKCALSLVIMAIATTIGQVIYLVRNHFTKLQREDYVFFVCILLIGGLAMFLLQLQKRYEIVEEMNDK